MIELLLSLIVAFTGIDRTVDPGLTSIAQARAAATDTDATFNHSGSHPGTAEVLSWNLNQPDPARRAAEQWRNSPGHWAILTDPSFTHIGCGHHVGPDGRHVFACVLIRSAVEPEVATRSPKPTSAGSTPAGGANTSVDQPPVVALPDTAMVYSGSH